MQGCCASAKSCRTGLRRPIRFFTVRRSDMGGNSSNPLGEFHCNEPGDYQITCLTPNHIRPGFLLEVTPCVSPGGVVPLILGTLLASFMTIGGLIVTLLKLGGQL